MTTTPACLRRVVGRFGLPVLLVVSGSWQAGCSILGQNDPASQFSRQNACPDKRMTVKTVVLQPAEVFERPSTPAGIVDDPKRRAAWEKRTDADLRQFIDLSYVDVSGCGVRRGYLCWKTPAPDGSTLEVHCPFTDGDRTPATNFGRFDLKANLWSTLRERAGDGEPAPVPSAASAPAVSSPPAVAAAPPPTRAAVPPRPTPPASERSSSAAATILELNEGERRVWRPLEGTTGEPGTFIVKFDRRTGGSAHQVLLMWDLPVGGQLRAHRLPGSDEIIFFHQGKARVTVGDAVREVSAGATVVVPAGTWIAVDNVGTDSLNAVFVFSAPGFEDFVHAASAPAGQPVVPLSRAEAAAILKRLQRTVEYRDPG